MPALDAVAASPAYSRDAADPRHVERALADLSAGLSRWRLAAALARLDIRNRYRGSVLGPFWMTASMAVMIAGIGLLYSTLFKMTLREYLPWLAVSLLVWTTINQVVTDACTAFTSSEGVIRQVPLPYTVHVLRFVMRNAIMAAHSLPLILVVFVVCAFMPGETPVLPGAEAVLALPGLALLLVNACAIGMFLGMVCARFRDIPQIVINLMQLVFFLSPVLWKPSLLGDLQVFLPLNPFFSLMETVRGPLVEGGAPPIVWAAALFYTAAACAIAFVFFVRFRGRIAFWV
jgi:lipopolysaccharide transport system permease protein